ARGLPAARRPPPHPRRAGPRPPPRGVAARAETSPRGGPPRRRHHRRGRIDQLPDVPLGRGVRRRPGTPHERPVVVRAAGAVRLRLRRRGRPALPRLPRVDALFPGRGRRPEADMTRLLVSVRSAAEASVALEGGAGLIDVKEPDNGPLGMAPPAVIAEVLRAVSGRVPVSAALGEVRDARDCLPGEIAAELAFVKYGAAGCLGEDRAVWESACRHARQRLDELHSRCRVVAAAYADWRAARSPAPDEICAFACD